MSMIGYFGRDGYGDSPYGSMPPLVGVVSATALNGTHVYLVFNELVDFTYGPLLEPSNYSISPALTVLSVEEAASNAVILAVTAQSPILYTVTVSQARSTYGQAINPATNSAIFTGFPVTPSYFSLATGPTRVRAVFAEVMLNDAALSNASNYAISDINGTSISIASATPEQATNPTSVLLELGTSLTTTHWYVTTVASNVKTAIGTEILPPTSVFQFVEGKNFFRVRTDQFSGEVSGGLFGNPDGLVFFSPALDVSTPNSILQIEEVDVCTTAYETYTPPNNIPIFPTPLFTYGAGIVPTPSPDPYLLNQTILWAPLGIGFEASLEIGFTPGDTINPVNDTSCSIVIQQQWALGYVALLNDPAYYMFNDTGTTTPPVFITANNLSPIPPGPETIIVLHMAIDGTSSMEPVPAQTVAQAAIELEGVSQLWAGNGPPPVVLAWANLSAGSSLTADLTAQYHPTLALQGMSYLQGFAIEGGPIPTVLEGGSDMVANGSFGASGNASIDGTSSAHGVVHSRRGATSIPHGSAGLTGTLHAHWRPHGVIEGSGQVHPTAKVTHKVEAFLAGVSSVSADGT